MDQASGFLNITATAPTRERAVAVSSAFSDGLLTYLKRLNVRRIDESQRLLLEQINTLQQQGVDPTVIASLRTGLSQLALDRTAPVPITTIQQATAVPVVAEGATAESGSLTAPKSRAVRTLLGALIGLLAGIVLALVLGAVRHPDPFRPGGGGSVRAAGPCRGPVDLAPTPEEGGDRFLPVLHGGRRIPAGRRRGFPLVVDQRQRTGPSPGRRNHPGHQPGSSGWEDHRGRESGGGTRTVGETGGRRLLRSPSPSDPRDVGSLHPTRIVGRPVRHERSSGCEGSGPCSVPRAMLDRAGRRPPQWRHARTPG